MRVYRIPPQPFRKPLQMLRDATGDVLKSAITNGVLYGLSAAFPPFGAFAIPAVTASSYLSLGKSLFGLYEDMIREGKVRPKSLKEVAESIGEFVSEGSADTVAAVLVERAQRSGILDQTARKFGVNRNVYEESLKGTFSSAISTGLGELAGLAIGRVVG